GAPPGGLPVPRLASRASRSSRPPLPAPAPASGTRAWFYRPACGESDSGRQARIGIRLVRDRHRANEVLLEARLDGRLDLLDPADDLLDLRARAAVEQRDPRTRTRGVAGRGDPIRLAVRDESEHERVARIDVRAKRSREPDPLDAVDPVTVHQQTAAGV